MKNRVVNKAEKEKKTLKKNRHINLGIIVYFLIFSYLLFCVLSFSFTKKINYTSAEPGSIVESEYFTGLIIKNEKVIYSKQSGMKNFFIHEGEKVKRGSLVAYVDQGDTLLKNMKKKIPPTKTEIDRNVELTRYDLDTLKSKMKSFTLNKDEKFFHTTYDLKSELEKMLFHSSNTIFLEDQKELTKLGIEEERLYYASDPGVISYMIDGFEGLTINNFNPSYLDQALSPSDILLETGTADKDPLFKLVDNYKWYIAAEINDVCEKYIEGKSQISLYVSQYDLNLNVKLKKLIHEEDKIYAVFEIDRYINEFLNLRFLDFKVIYNNVEGIKIPNSAIVKKMFLKIPKEALISSNQGFQIQKKIINDKAVSDETLKGIPIYLYRSDEKNAYIPVSEEIKVGDTVLFYQEDGSNSFFQIEEMKELEGIYVINKGFADFKFIDVVSYTKDYKIVRSTTVYGVNPYDRIATHGSQLTDLQIIY